MKKRQDFVHMSLSGSGDQKLGPENLGVYKIDVLLYKISDTSLLFPNLTHVQSRIVSWLDEIYNLKIRGIALFTDRDVQHNVSYSIFTENRQGAVYYASAGEVNPTITVEWSQFIDNCRKLYGNFTTCEAAVLMDVQNTQNLFFRVSAYTDETTTEHKFQIF